MPAALNAAAVLDGLMNGVVVVDDSDRLLWANPSFLSLYGMATLAQARDRTFEQIYRDAWSAQPVHLQGGAHVDLMRDRQRASGAPFELRLPGNRFVRVVERRGEADGCGYFEHIDITQQKRQQANLAVAEERYRLLAEYSSDIILAVEKGLLTYASPALTELLGWSSSEVLGKSVAEFCHGDDFARVAEIIRSSSDSYCAEYEMRARHKDGSFVWVEGRSRHLPGKGSDITTHRVVNLRGIAARKEMQFELERAKQRLEALATTDPLTQLANRRKLDEWLAVEFRRATRDRTALSLLLIDIDHFKTFNDTQGHGVGDDVLSAVADLLRKHVHRAGDLAARQGGDEFVIVLPNTAQGQALEFAERLRQSIQQASVADALGQITASMGVATLKSSGGPLTPGKLMMLADQALYAAKRNGRNRVVAAGQG